MYSSNNSCFLIKIRIFFTYNQWMLQKLNGHIIYNYQRFFRVTLSIYKYIHTWFWAVTWLVFLTNLKLQCQMNSILSFKVVTIKERLKFQPSFSEKTFWCLIKVKAHKIFLQKNIPKMLSKCLQINLDPIWCNQRFL